MNKTNKNKTIKKYRRIYIGDPTVEIIFENCLVKRDKNKNVLFIYSEDEFRNLLSKEFTVSEVIILSETKWDERYRQEFIGYEIAQKIMNSIKDGDHFSLLFVSILTRESLLKLNKSQSRIFVKKFPHLCLTDKEVINITIPPISFRKFKYLKNYCLLEIGIIDRLEHDCKNLSNNYNPTKAEEFITELRANKEILNEKILNCVDTFYQVTTAEEKIEVLKAVYLPLLELKNKFNNRSEEVNRKSFSRVMLIEDDNATLRKLERQLGLYFNSITSFKNGSKALDELKTTQDKKYDVVITDMELLEDQFDGVIQGIDILEYCETNLPFLATRIITALPKEALKQLTGKNPDEILYKSMGSDLVISPFEDLNNFVKNIDQEVKKKENLRSMKGPKISWWRKYLTKQLYLTEVNDPKEFQNIWGKAIDKVDKFIEDNNDLCSDQNEIKIQFKHTKETVDHPEAGWEIIDLLLAHRLIALWFAFSKHKGKAIYWDEYTNQPGIQADLSNRTPKAYFNTFLGLRGKGLPDTSESGSSFKLLRSDLFPLEEDWLKKHVSLNKNQELLENISIPFAAFLEDIVDIFGIKSKNLQENITIEIASNILEEFIKQFTVTSSKCYFLLESYENSKDEISITTLPEILKQSTEEIIINLLLYTFMLENEMEPGEIQLVNMKERFISKFIEKYSLEDKKKDEKKDIVKDAKEELGKIIKFSERYFEKAPDQIILLTQELGKTYFLL